MSQSDMLGIAATVITTFYTCFGLPVQIFKSVQRRSVEGLSLVMTCMMLLTFASWVVYAFSKSPIDWYVIISNTPGAVCSLIILMLFAAFPRKASSAAR